jgi:hypothetical protein
MFLVPCLHIYVSGSLCPCFLVYTSLFLIRYVADSCTTYLHSCSWGPGSVHVSVPDSVYSWFMDYTSLILVLHPGSCPTHLRSWFCPGLNISSMVLFFLVLALHISIYGSACYWFLSYSSLFMVLHVPGSCSTHFHS